MYCKLCVIPVVDNYWLLLKIKLFTPWSEGNFSANIWSLRLIYLRLPSIFEWPINVLVDDNTGVENSFYRDHKKIWREYTMNINNGKTSSWSSDDHNLVIYYTIQCLMKIKSRILLSIISEVTIMHRNCLSNSPKFTSQYIHTYFLMSYMLPLR